MPTTSQNGHSSFWRCVQRIAYMHIMHANMHANMHIIIFSVLKIRFSKICKGLLRTLKNVNFKNSADTVCHVLILSYFL